MALVVVGVISSIVYGKRLRVLEEKIESTVAP
jgi:hypothetical protein